MGLSPEGVGLRQQRPSHPQQEEGRQACTQGAGRCAYGVCLLLSPVSFLSECFRFLPTDKARGAGGLRREKEVKNQGAWESWWTRGLSGAARPKPILEAGEHRLGTFLKIHVFLQPVSLPGCSRGADREWNCLSNSDWAPSQPIKSEISRTHPPVGISEVLTRAAGVQNHGLNKAKGEGRVPRRAGDPGHLL